jgi:ankyrin repeat protein
MVDLLYELGASLDIKNRQGLTPLTLAAVKAHKEVRQLTIFVVVVERKHCEFN